MLIKTKFFRNRLSKEIREQGATPGGGIFDKFGKKGMKSSLPDKLDYKSFENRKAAVSYYLQKVVEAVSANANAQILEKTGVYRLIGLPPVNIETFQGTPIFFRDPELSFQTYMSYGKDFSVSKEYNTSS